MAFSLIDESRDVAATVPLFVGSWDLVAAVPLVAESWDVVAAVKLLDESWVVVAVSALPIVATRDSRSLFMSQFISSAQILDPLE